MHNDSTKIKFKRRSGFTLIEMIIALSIFVLIVLIVASIFVTINNSQRRVVNSQKLQDDIRYTMEAISQEIRLGKVNYYFYSHPSDVYGYSSSGPIDLHPSASTPVSVLALVNQSGQRVFFNYDTVNNSIFYCKEISLNDCSILDKWQPITSADTKIINLQFVISPSADPFTETESQSCASAPCAGNYLSYRCAADQLCRYFSDGNNFQPKVRIIIKSQNKGPQAATLTIQSTVSSRIIPSKVLNSNYDL